ncbi:TolB family protein [candidate division KSB1 bacterium]
MKRLITFMFSLCLIVSAFSNYILQDDSPALKGPYLGQDPPGMKAEIFDPGIFPENEFRYCSGFLNDGTVFVFTSKKQGTDRRLRPTYVTELKNGRWTEPEIAPFSEYMPFNFTVGSGGQIIYFTTLKSPDKTTDILLEQSNIWMVSMQKNGWTEPVMLGSSINTVKYNESYPAVALNGTIYYMSNRKGGYGRVDVYRSKYLGGRYGPAENVGPVINTEGSDQDPFIAPDESYLIVCQDKPAGFGKYDLYISFRKEDGSWTKLINMGPDINSTEYDFRPYVTPDGKYLFFTCTSDVSGNIHWVDAKIIEQLRSNHLK